MSRPRNNDQFRLFKRKLDGEALYYCRVLDEEGKIIATRSTGTTDERKAIKKAIEILKSIPKSPLKNDPLFVDFLISFWQRSSDFVQLRELDGHRLSNTYLDKTKYYGE